MYGGVGALPAWNAQLQPIRVCWYVCVVSSVCYLHAAKLCLDSMWQESHTSVCVV